MRTLLLCLLFVGCQRASDVGPSPSLDASLQRRIEALGDRVPLVVVLDPQGWPTVANRLFPLMKGLPNAEEVLKLDSPEAVIRRVLEGPELPGFDPDAPVVVGLWEPAVVGANGAVAALLPFDRPLPGFRHTALLPAKDPARLATRIEVLIGKDEEKRGFGRASSVFRGEAHVRVVAEERQVRVEVTLGGPPFEAPHVKPRDTPALQVLARRGYAIGVLVRPRLVEAAMNQQNLHLIRNAAAQMEIRYRPALLARGLAEVLTGARAMRVGKPELGDHAVTLTADEAGLSLTGMAELTAEGRRLLVAGAERAGRLLAHEPGAIQLALPFDLGASLDQATPALWGDFKEISRTFSECGIGCWWSWTFQAPLALMRTVYDQAAAQKTPIPRAVQAVVRYEEGQTRVALAADVGADFDTGLLRSMLPDSAYDLHRVPLGDRVALLVGLRLDPRTVFKTDAPAPQLPFFTLEAARVAGEVAKEVPEFAGYFDRFRRLQVDLAAGEGALAWRLHMAIDDKAPAPLVAPSVAAIEAPPAPTGPEECLTRALTGLAHALEAAAREEDPARAVVQLGGTAASGFATDLACARSDPRTAPAADGLDRQFSAFMAEFANAPPPEPAAPISVVPPPDALPEGVDRLTPPHIQAVMRRNIKAFRWCYEQALVKDTKLAGRVTLRLTIDGNGTVSAAEAEGLEGTDVPVCIAKAANRLRFPAQESGTPTKVTYPFVFSPAE